MVSNMVCRIIPMHQCLLVIAVHAFLLFLCTQFSNTTVFYTYILLLLLFSSILFCNSFIPPFTLIHSLLFFQVPSVTSWRTASSLVLSFSAISYSGDKPQRMTRQRIGEKKALLTSPIATPKRRALNDGCQLWGLRGTEWKAFRHTTFCISRIVAGTTGQIQRVVCNMGKPHKSTSEVPDRWQAFLSVPTDAHLLHGLAVPAFLCSLA